MGIFWDREDDKKAEAKPVVKVETAVQPVISTPNAYVPYGTGIDNSVITPTVSNNASNQTTVEMQAHLTDALGRHAWQGVNYLGFKSTVAALQPFISDEKICLTAAFETAKKTNPTASVQVLLSTADECLTLLDQEHNSFEQEIANSVAGLQSGPEAQIKTLDVSLQTCARQMADLQVQIEAIKKQQQDLQKTSETKRQAIESQRASFVAAFQSMKTTIESDKQKISLYLGN